MKTKIFSILLCLLLAFTLVFAVACGNKDDNGDGGNTNTNTDTSTDTATDTNTDTSTDTSTDEAEVMHKVTFILDNGEEDVVRNIKHGTVTIGVPVNISKPGYTFAGWTLNGESWDETSRIESDITVTAVWTANENVLIYDANCSDARGTMANSTVVTGGKITLATNAYTRTGYVFKGWATSANGAVVYENGAEYEMGTEAQNKLYAVWAAFEYQIEYDLGAQDAVNNADNPTKYTVAELVTFKNPTREGWIFKGWTLDGIPTVDTADLTGGITLVATWARPKYEIVYNYNDIVNVNNVSNSDNPVDMTCEDTVTLANASCNGFVFEGWFSDAEFTTPVTELSNISAKTTIYGKFSYAKYTVTYELPEGVTNVAENIAEFNITTEFTFLAPTVNVTGYEFDGWYVNGEKVEGIVAGTTENIEVEAQLKPTVYTITYEGSVGLMPVGTITEYTVESEFDKITLPTIEIAGVTFNGWFSDAELTSSITEIVLDKANPSNITVYVSLEMTKYNITYVFPEGIDATTVVNPNATWYADAVTVTFAPVTLDGYKLVGFYKEATFENAITSTEGLTGDITVYVNLKPSVDQIGKDQVESFEGTTKYGSYEQLFDGNIESAGTWYVGNGWASGSGASGTLILDDEYLIKSGSVYFWSNYSSAQIKFYDAEGNNTYTYAGPDNNNVLQDTSGAEFKFGNEASFKVKKIVIETQSSKGDRNMQFVELILKVDNDAE